jgi:hypothetical protein
MAIYVSACLSENSSRFLLAGRAVDSNDDEQNLGNAVDNMYARRRKINWLLNPAIGVALGIIFLAGIYFASRTRVELMKMSGDLSKTTASFHVYIPVILYFVEILFGIPAFLFMLWICNLANIRKLRRNLAQERDQEIIINQAAIKDYEEYIAQLGEYNSSLELDGRPPRPPIPPNRVLRRLLVDSGHYDVADMGNQPTHRRRTPSDNTHDEMNPQPTGESESQETRDNAQMEDNEDSRIDDLTNLLDNLDDRISNQNRGI